MRGTEGFKKGDRVRLKNGEEVVIQSIIGVPMEVRNGIETRCAYQTDARGFRLDEIDRILESSNELTPYQCPKCHVIKQVYPNMVAIYRKMGMCEGCKEKQQIEEFQQSFDALGHPVAARKAQNSGHAPCNLANIQIPQIWSPNSAPIDRATTASFTGHRPDKLCIDKRMAYRADNPVMLKVRKALEKQIDRLIGEGVTTFISGMALGVDQLAAEVVLEFRENLGSYADIKLVAAVPFYGQELKWPEKSQRQFHKILSEADGIVYVHEPRISKNTGEPMAENDSMSFQQVRQFMQDRNEWMVNHSDFVIAVWDGTPGGTGNCVRYAEKAKHSPQILRVDPTPFKTITA